MSKETSQAKTYGFLQVYIEVISLSMGTHISFIFRGYEL